MNNDKMSRHFQIKVTNRHMISCLLIINIIAVVLQFSVYTHLGATTPTDAHENRLLFSPANPQPQHHSNAVGNIKYIDKVPLISDGDFYKNYNTYNGRLPELERHSRVADPSCGQVPDYFDFFRLPKSLHSRFFEDKIIYDTFFKPTVSSLRGGNQQIPKLGTYVELGAFDGQEESNTIFFDKCLGWDGLLIEAQSESYQKVIQNRPNAVKLSFSPTCVDNMNGKGQQQTASFYNIPLSNNGMKDMAQSYIGRDTVEVPCGPLTPVLLDIFGPNQTISFFSLDVEGAETLVLDTLDFSKIHIDVMMIEIQNSYCPNPMACPNVHLIRKKMAEANYALFAELVEASDVFARVGTEAWKRGMSVRDENARNQWILKRMMLRRKEQKQG